MVHGLSDSYVDGTHCSLSGCDWWTRTCYADPLVSLQAKENEIERLSSKEQELAVEVVKLRQLNKKKQAETQELQSCVGILSGEKADLSEGRHTEGAAPPTRGPGRCAEAGST